MFTDLADVMSLAACRLTLDAAASINDTESVLGPEFGSPKASTSARLMNAPGPEITVMFVGSSSQVPVRPAGARVSMLPVTARLTLPEVSTNPPLPPVAPPRALINP